MWVVEIRGASINWMLGEFAIVAIGNNQVDTTIAIDLRKPTIKGKPTTERTATAIERSTTATEAKLDGISSTARCGPACAPVPCVHPLLWTYLHHTTSIATPWKPDTPLGSSPSQQRPHQHRVLHKHPLGTHIATFSTQSPATSTESLLFPSPKPIPPPKSPCPRCIYPVNTSRWHQYPCLWLAFWWFSMDYHRSRRF